MLFRFQCCLFSLNVFLKIAVFKFFWEPSHGSGTNHDIYCLLESQENILFDVWHTMTAANFLDKRCRLLITQHGKIWPHVVLNLVVQPSVEEVNSIGSHTVIDTGQYLAKEERTRKRSTTFAEPIHVIACMVRNNSIPVHCFAVSQMLTYKE